MRLSTLKKAKQEDILRLSKWLHLKTHNMSYRQILKLIRWRISRKPEGNRY